MTPNEIAMKFSSASATCRNGKCLYTSECRGTSETCRLKEVALVIRSLMAENKTLRTQNDHLNIVSQEMSQYIKDLKRVNEYYYDVCQKFQNGYRPKTKIVKKDARTYRKKKPKNVLEMDGDPRYEHKESKVKTELPVVII